MTLFTPRVYFLTFVLINLIFTGCGAGKNGNSGNPFKPFFSEFSIPPIDLKEIGKRPQKSKGNSNETVNLSQVCPPSLTPIVCPTYSDTYQQNLCNTALSAARINHTGKAFYRWERKIFADQRVARGPNGTPYTYFGYSPNKGEISSNAMGGTAFGLGLYMSRGPVSTASYDRNQVGDKALISIILAPGTPYLSLKGMSAAGLTSSAILGLNPPFPGAIQATSRLKGGMSTDEDYWVLKTNEGVCVRYFTGEFNTTQDLLRFKVFPLFADTEKYFHGQVADTLRSRIFNPGKNIQLPLPREAVYPFDEGWDRITPPITTDVDLNQPWEYFWNYAGTCNAVLNGGAILLSNSIDLSECRKQFPLGKPAWNSSGFCQAPVLAAPEIIVTLDDQECS
ncbi:MAG: hypothetical protein HYX41_00645 [Bdellovibrio sp.]|nr:hypothetical protein [Bdellovibrio sp.]